MSMCSLPSLSLRFSQHTSVEASTTMFGAIAKRRLTIYKDSIYQQLDDVFQQDDIEKA